MENIWEEVLWSRTSTLGDLPGEMTPTHTNVDTESESESDNTFSILETDLEREVEYDPATYGLAPGAPIRATVLVNVAKNGELCIYIV